MNSRIRRLSPLRPIRPRFPTSTTSTDSTTSPCSTISHFIAALLALAVALLAVGFAHWTVGAPGALEVLRHHPPAAGALEAKWARAMGAVAEGGGGTRIMNVSPFRSAAVAFLEPAPFRINAAYTTEAI